MRKVASLLSLAFCIVAAPARAQLDAKQCVFAGCALGDPVVTTPSKASGPGCSREALVPYVAYVDRLREPDEQHQLAATQLRLQAGVRTLEEAHRHCHPVPAAQRARVSAVSIQGTGVLQITPLDGSAPYWLSNFDVSRP